MASETAMLIKTIIGVIIAFSAAGMVAVVINLWENYWNSRERVESYKKYIAQSVSERIEEEKKHHE